MQENRLATGQSETIDVINKLVYLQNVQILTSLLPPPHPGH